MRRARFSGSRWLVVAVVVAVAGGAAVSPVSASPPLEAARTLTREYDPVVVPVSRLTSVAGRRSDRVGLFRAGPQGLAPVPFQFDPRDEKGEIDVDAAPGFRLDGNDELVFMAKDTGDRTPQSDWPEGCDAALEIELTDPVGGERAWVYLLSFAEAAVVRSGPVAPISGLPADGAAAGVVHVSAPAAHVSAPAAHVVLPDDGAVVAPIGSAYVTYEAPTNSASSAYYRVAYAGARNYFTALSIAPSAAGSGSNLLRQTRMHGRPTFSLLLTDVSLNFTEENSIVEIDGVRSGPVRVVRRVRLSVDLGPLFPELPNGTAYTYHYLTSYWTPSRISFPWIMVKALRQFDFEAVIDFRPDAMPLRYFDAANPDGVDLAGPERPVADEIVDHDWWVHSGPSGTMLHAFQIPEKWRRWGIARGAVLHVGDRGAADRTDAGADAAGRTPEFGAGYSLLNMTRLQEAGSYELMQASFVLPRPFQPGDEVAPMASLRAPLQIAVRSVW